MQEAFAAVDCPLIGDLDDVIQGDGDSVLVDCVDDIIYSATRRLDDSMVL